VRWVTPLDDGARRPNEYGVNMHWAATAWVLVGGFLRLRGSPAAPVAPSSSIDAPHPSPLAAAAADKHHGASALSRGDDLRGRAAASECVKESGCAYILAAYTFFGGQMGLTLWADHNKANVGSYVLAWHAIPIVAILAYVRIFCVPGASGTDPRHAPGSSTAAGASPGDLEGGTGFERSRLLGGGEKAG